MYEVLLDKMEGYTSTYAMRLRSIQLTIQQRLVRASEKYAAVNVTVMA